MNRPLRRVATAVLLLFALLMLNINYLQVFDARSLRNQRGNTRVLVEEYSRQRGPVVVDGSAIASSKETADRLKYLRTYANGPLWAPVTGYYSVIFGGTAIERTEDTILSGSDDKLFIRRFIDLLTGRPAQGGSVVLTLSAKAQKAAYDGLAGRRGAVVAIDPSTGAILALATSPSYDPNILSSHDPSAIRAAWTKLNADPNQPLLDRALVGAFPPGSTFKIVTAAAALSSGRFLPSSKIPGPASLPLPQTTISLPNDDNRQCTPGSNTTTLANALRRSCNTSFGWLGMNVGADALRAQADKFGFDQSFDVPMTAATSRFPAAPNVPQTAQSAIGQYDVRATALQMAMVVAAVANRGVLMKPYLVQRVLGPDLSTLDQTSPTSLGEAVSPVVAQELATMLVDVVDNGTGTNAQIPGVKVAGKTGTAQTGTAARPHAWFVSFAPEQDPKVAVAVIVENGGDIAEVSGNKVAAPIAKAVMQAVLNP